MSKKRDCNRRRTLERNTAKPPLLLAHGLGRAPFCSALGGVLGSFAAPPECPLGRLGSVLAIQGGVLEAVLRQAFEIVEVFKVLKRRLKIAKF